MPLKPIKTQSRLERRIQAIKQNEDAFDAYKLALRLKTLYKNNKKAKKYLLEIENVIKKEPEIAFLYASNILKRDWPEAEPYILKDPWVAYKYARRVLKRRWPEAEPVIKQDRVTYNYYRNFFKIK